MVQQIKHLIGKKTIYGSPGYGMFFIPREIILTKEDVTVSGEIPESPLGVQGHFFSIKVSDLSTLIEEGEVSWVSKDGAYNEWRLI